jgi:hypothetical protein
VGIRSIGRKSSHRPTYMTLIDMVVLAPTVVRDAFLRSRPIATGHRQAGGVATASDAVNRGAFNGRVIVAISGTQSWSVRRLRRRQVASVDRPARPANLEKRGRSQKTFRFAESSPKCIHSGFDGLYSGVTCSHVRPQAGHW